MKPGEQPSRSSKPIYVLNATPVIHFSKIGRLNQVLEICEAFITKEVHDETVVRGEDFPDSLAIKDAVESGRLKVYQVKTENRVKALLKYREIHRGEAETIVAAKELGGIAIIDDKEARVIAKVCNVKTAPGYLFLLFRLLKLGKMDPKEAKRGIEELMDSGLHLDSETLLEVYGKLGETVTTPR